MRLNKTWRGRLSSSGSASARIGRYLVLGLGALAGFGMVWHFLFTPPTDVVGPARTVVNKAAVVSSLAQDFVTVWLTATSADTASLAQFVTMPNDAKLPTTPAVVITAPTVVAVTYEGTAGKDGAAELYSVVVGVTQRPYESASPVRAVYRVPVLWSAYGPRAVGLPARVGGPGPGADLPTAYPTTVGQSDSPFQVVSGFMTAYLTSAGGVDRYVTADSLLTGFGDAYQSATVTRVTATETPAAKPADGQTVRVLASVAAVTSQYAPVQLVYPLTLRGVDGHWSVAAIDRAPAMAGGEDLVPVVTESPAK
jgi:Conjugative transposon protein TcpC